MSAVYVSVTIVVVSYSSSYSSPIPCYSFPILFHSSVRLCFTLNVVSYEVTFLVPHLCGRLTYGATFFVCNILVPPVAHHLLGQIFDAT